jgi:hypothetical protein
MVGAVEDINGAVMQERAMVRSSAEDVGEVRSGQRADQQHGRPCQFPALTVPTAG